MSFEASLREELQGIPELFNRVFPLSAPESFPAPYVVYVSSDGTKDKTLSGFLSTKQVHAEINIICASYGGLKSLTPEVSGRLESFLCRSIGTSAPIYIRDITIMGDPVEIYETELKMYRSVIEIIVQI